jgi:hypothetical protein
MVGPIDEAPIYVSLDEVAVLPGCKVLIQVDENNVVIDGSQQRVLNKTLRPRSI